MCLVNRNLPHITECALLAFLTDQREWKDVSLPKVYFDLVVIEDVNEKFPLIVPETVPIGS